MSLLQCYFKGFHVLLYNDLTNDDMFLKYKTYTKEIKAIFDIKPYWLFSQITILHGRDNIFTPKQCRLNMKYSSFKVQFKKSAFCTVAALKTISSDWFWCLDFFTKNPERFNICKREGTIVRGTLVNGGTCLQMRSRQDSGNRPNNMKAINLLVFSPTPFIATFLWRHNTVW